MKKVEKTKSTLEIDEDLDLHKTGWIVQHIGWIILLLALIAAALGVFGEGVLSDQTISQNSHTIRYEKLGRYEAQIDFEIEAASQNGTIEIILDKNFLNNFEIEKIVPEPAGSTTKGDGIAFSYNYNAPALIRFYVLPRSYGRVQTRIKINNTNFDLSHFIYP